MNEYLSFKRMITPAFIQVIFWIGILVIVIGGFTTMAQAGFLSGLGVFVVGALMVRINCELLIVLFKIYDSLAKIEKNTAPQ